MITPISKTMPTPKKLSRQQIFNKAVTHLLTQKARSAANGVCLYRGPDGLKCVVGAFIPDEEYTKDLEQNAVPEDEHFIALVSDNEKAVSRLALVAILQAQGIDMEKDGPLLRSLQRVHDHDTTPWGKDDSRPPVWTPSLRRVASDYGLKQPKILQDAE